MSRLLRRDDGAAVVEFVLVSVLLSVLLLAVLQLGLALHVRTVLVSAAADGARYAANADRLPDDGAGRTRSLIQRALPSSYADDVTAREEVVDGRAVIAVTVHARLPLLGLLGPARSLTVTGHALAEAP